MFGQPELTDLTDFINQETVLVNDALVSIHIVSQLQRVNINQKGGMKKGKIKTFLTGSIYETSIAKFKSPKKCPVGEKFHDVEDCTVYLTKPVEERSKLLYILKLCYGCLEPISKKHNVRKHP